LGLTLCFETGSVHRERGHLGGIRRRQFTGCFLVLLFKIKRLVGCRRSRVPPTPGLFWPNTEHNWEPVRDLLWAAVCSQIFTVRGWTRNGGLGVVEIFGIIFP